MDEGDLNDEMDAFDCGEDCDCGAEPTPRERFQGLVQTILGLTAGAGAVYERLTATAAPFDGELARRLEACRKADEELIAYCRRKAEAG